MAVMSPELAALLTALLGVTGAIVVLIAQVKKARRDVQEARRDVQAVHILMNSRLDELLDTTRRLARAEGVKEGLEGQDDG